MDRRLGRGEPHDQRADMELSYLTQRLQCLVKPGAGKGEYQRAANRALPCLLLGLVRPKEQTSLVAQRRLKKCGAAAYRGRPTIAPVELVEERLVAAL
jgi:hypothetical protein